MRVHGIAVVTVMGAPLCRYCEVRANRTFRFSLLRALFASISVTIQVPSSDRPVDFEKPDIQYRCPYCIVSAELMGPSTCWKLVYFQSLDHLILFPEEDRAIIMYHSLHQGPGHLGIWRWGGHLASEHPFPIV